MTDRIALPAPILAWIDAEIAAGRFASREALVEKALAFYKRELEAARAFIAPALAEAERGEGQPAEEVFAELRRTITARTAAE